VFTYSLMFIFGMAWYKKDTKIFDYVILLSSLGIFIALYHHYLQMGYNLYTPCSSSPFAVSCAKPTFIEFGFITLPFMGFVTQGFIMLIAITGKLFKK